MDYLWRDYDPQGRSIPDFSVEEFLPKISVYSGLMPRALELVDALKYLDSTGEKSEVFSDSMRWAKFGTTRNFNGNQIVELLPSQCENPERFTLERELFYMVLDAYFTATNHYMSSSGVTRESDWTILGPSFDMYSTSTEDSLAATEPKRLAMNWHTDYQIFTAPRPGNKFLLTTTMYLNDDFSGGEVEFLINKSGNPKLYTPKVGDVVVFPSGHPDYLSEDGIYFHGVRAIDSGSKYFIRMFYQKYYPGDEEWLANQKKYGEDVWEAMEEARISAQRLGKTIVEPGKLDPEAPSCGF